MNFFADFLSAAQPTDQGEESVVLVVVVGDHFSVSHVQLFGMRKGKNFVLKGVRESKNFVSKGVKKGKKI